MKTEKEILRFFEKTTSTRNYIVLQYKDNTYEGSISGWGQVINFKADTLENLQKELKKLFVPKSERKELEISTNWSYKNKINFIYNLKRIANTFNLKKENISKYTDWSNKKDVLEMVEENGNNYRFISENLKEDKEILITALNNIIDSPYDFAVEENTRIFELGGENLKKDKDIIKLAIEKEGIFIVNFIPKQDFIEKEIGGVDKWIKQQEEPSQKKRKPIDNQVEVDTDKQNEK